MDGFLSQDYSAAWAAKEFAEAGFGPIQETVPDLASPSSSSPFSSARPSFESNSAPAYDPAALPSSLTPCKEVFEEDWSACLWDPQEDMPLFEDLQRECFVVDPMEDEPLPLPLLPEEQQEFFCAGQMMDGVMEHAMGVNIPFTEPEMPSTAFPQFAVADDQNRLISLPPAAPLLPAPPPAPRRAPPPDAPALAPTAPLLEMAPTELSFSSADSPRSPLLAVPTTTSSHVAQDLGPMSRRVEVPQRKKPGRKPIADNNDPNRRRVQNRNAQRKHRQSAAEEKRAAKERERASAERERLQAQIIATLKAEKSQLLGELARSKATNNGNDQPKR